MSDYSIKGYTWKCADGAATADVWANSPEANAALTPVMDKLRELEKLTSYKGNLFKPAFSYNFPGYPLLGSLVLMPLFTLGASGVFAWLTLRSGSFWPAVLAHASFNSTAGPLIYLPVFEAEPLVKYLLFVVPWVVLGIAGILHLKMTEGTGAWDLYPAEDL